VKNSDSIVWSWLTTRSVWRPRICSHYLSLLVINTFVAFIPFWR